ncbi:MAG: NADH-quinone oxidoreductase subunit K [Anaerolineales bacterium]|nr:NADH-quinone oxidoreductase subunit K [Anaerolineales bacterium]
MEILTAIAIGAMFGVGVFQMLRRNVLRSVIGLFILFNAMNLFLLSTGAYSGEAAAYAYAVEQKSDALPQALILTAIVIGMGGFALILSMLYILSVRYKTSDSDEIAKLRY